MASLAAPPLLRAEGLRRRGHAGSPGRPRPDDRGHGRTQGPRSHQGHDRHRDRRSARARPDVALHPLPEGARQDAHGHHHRRGRH
ncbi:MAG: hypothetical protein M0C28_00790 [Candidatus Moduliflexus flocculans]|nr:hypothetical protein [Candidatus Moduliflexus flocculans]